MRRARLLLLLTATAWALAAPLTVTAQTATDNVYVIAARHLFDSVPKPQQLAVASETVCSSGRACKALGQEQRQALGVAAETLSSAVRPCWNGRRVALAELHRPLGCSGYSILAFSPPHEAEGLVVLKVYLIESSENQPAALITYRLLTLDKLPTSVDGVSEWSVTEIRSGYTHN